MAAKIMNISLKQHKHKSQALEILDGFPTAFFFADFYHCGFTKQQLELSSSYSSRLFWKRKNQKNVWNNILIAPKKVPQKHNGILKFAQFIYFLQQLACLFCTITFNLLYLWTMPMDHLAWIMSWVPFFIQVPFFPFWWANENKSSLLTSRTNSCSFFMMEEKNDPTYHLLLTIFCLKKYYPLFCVCVFLV